MATRDCMVSESVNYSFKGIDQKYWFVLKRTSEYDYNDDEHVKLLNSEQHYYTLGYSYYLYHIFYGRKSKSSVLCISEFSNWIIHSTDSLKII